MFKLIIQTYPYKTLESYLPVLILLYIQLTFSMVSIALWGIKDSYNFILFVSFHKKAMLKYLLGRKIVGKESIAWMDFTYDNDENWLKRLTTLLYFCNLMNQNVDQNVKNIAVHQLSSTVPHMNIFLKCILIDNGDGYPIYCD